MALLASKIATYYCDALKHPDVGVTDAPVAPVLLHTSAVVQVTR